MSRIHLGFLVYFLIWNSFHFVGALPGNIIGRTENAQQVLFAGILNNDMLKIHRAIAAGVNVNIQSTLYNRKTPLLFAVILNRTEAASLLLQSGADVNARDEYHNTPLMIAVMDRNVEMIKVLLSADRINLNLRNGSKQSILTLAMQSGYAEVLQLLIDRGVDVNARDANGNTPLMNAVISGNAAAVSTLVSVRSIDLDMVDKFGISALNQAIFRHDVKIIKLLIEAGVDINVKDKSGNSPLMVAVWDQNVDVVRMLLSLPGIDVNVINHSHQSILMEAISRGDIDIVDSLIKAGADVNQKVWGMTPFMVAYRKGNRDITAKLIEAGAGKTDNADEGLTDAEFAVIHKVRFSQFLKKSHEK